MKNKKTNLLRIRTPFILTFEVIQVAGGVFCYFISIDRALNYVYILH